MDEHFETWEAPAPLPDMEKELKRMHRSLRRRNWKIICISLILAAAILLGTVNFGIPALESLYWDPDTTSYGTQSTDLEMTFYAYGNIFNNDCRVMDISTVRTGFGSYALSLESVSYSKNERSFGTATLEKGTLTVQEGFWDDWGQHYVGNYTQKTQDNYMEILSQLPDYIRVGCYVTFQEDITMEEALALEQTLIQDFFDTYNYTQIRWYAIRHREDAYSRPCGLSNDGSIGMFDEVNTRYPYFSNTTHDVSGNPLSGEPTDLAARKEERFKSLLRYLNDQQQKGEGIEVPNYPNYYADALEYVEENGVKVYGLYLTTSAKTLLKINEMENVRYLTPVDAWIRI